MKGHREQDLREGVGSKKSMAERGKWLWEPKAARVGVRVGGVFVGGHQEHKSRMSEGSAHKKVLVRLGPQKHCSPKAVRSLKPCSLVSSPRRHTNGEEGWAEGRYGMTQYLICISHCQMQPCLLTDVTDAVDTPSGKH